MRGVTLISAPKWFHSKMMWNKKHWGGTSEYLVRFSFTWFNRYFLNVLKNLEIKDDMWAGSDSSKGQYNLSTLHLGEFSNIAIGTQSTHIWAWLDVTFAKMSTDHCIGMTSLLCSCLRWSQILAALKHVCEHNTFGLILPIPLLVQSHWKDAPAASSGGGTVKQPHSRVPQILHQLSIWHKSKERMGAGKLWKQFGMYHNH